MNSELLGHSVFIVQSITVIMKPQLKLTNMESPIITEFDFELLNYRKTRLLIIRELKRKLVAQRQGKTLDVTSG